MTTKSNILSPTGSRVNQEFVSIMEVIRRAFSNTEDTLHPQSNLSVALKTLLLE
jgi:hypothetical protein